jgi:hypothetical protein
MSLLCWMETRYGICEELHETKMGGGVVLAATRDVVAMIRHSTLFLLTLEEGQLVLQRSQELLANLPTAETAEDDAETVAENKQHPAKQGVTATAFFQPDAADPGIFALLLLVDERRLVHYEANVLSKTVELRSVRAMPRNSTCMTVSRLTVNGDVKHVVIVGEKTGEAVAMPFPDFKRDRKTLMGHTTSMITCMAPTKDASLLLTADRDEKIRVSHFPRTALVQSYCLGHKAALTRVVVSSVTPELAISTSLDNTIKLWDVASGALLASHELLANSDDQDALLNVSLTISATTNLVVVVVNDSELRFFAIEKTGEMEASFTLSPKTLSAQMQVDVVAHEPTSAVFTERGVLVLAYRKSPFLRVFDVASVTEGSVALSEHSAHDELTRLRNEAATIGTLFLQYPPHLFVCLLTLRQNCPRRSGRRMKTTRRVDSRRKRSSSCGRPRSWTRRRPTR